MATVVNNPGNDNSGNALGLMLGVIFILVIAVLFFMYVVPTFRQSGGGAPQVNVPGKIDVNVHQGEGK